MRSASPSFRAHRCGGVRLASVLGALLGASLGVPGQAAEAQPAPTLLEVEVVDSASGQPLGNVLVLLDQRGVGLTDAAGVYRLASLPAAQVLLELRFIGRRVERRSVHVLAGRTTRVQVALVPDPIPLPGVRAETEALPRSAALRAFYERAKRGGRGRFITRADIDRQRPTRLTDLFRLIPGVAVESTPFSERTLMGVASTPMYTPDHRQQECPILYFLDGTPLDVSGDGYIGLGLRPAEVEGIEVYQSATEVPARYRRSIKHCGVVLIWKRERH